MYENNNENNDQNVYYNQEPIHNEPVKSEMEGVETSQPQQTEQEPKTAWTGQPPRTAWTEQYRQTEQDWKTGQSQYREPEVTVKKKKKERKPSAFGKFLGKACRLVASAAVFGIVAGGVFYSVNYMADKKLGTNVVTPTEEAFEIGTLYSPASSDKTSTISSTGLGMDVSELVQSSMPAMVSVTGTVTVNYNFWPVFGGGTTESPTAGSGVIIGKSEDELLIVTNAHVVDQVNDLKVSFVDGTTADAMVKGSKANKDIAVISVKLADLTEETRSSIAIIEIGDSDQLAVGQPIIAIGNALGEGQSVTVGWVSSLKNTITIDGTVYEDLVRISAAINPGNSGGALLNPQGQLIGINSAKSTETNVEGIGYAIPISSVREIINDLMNRVNRDKVEEGQAGFLGISGIDITSDISRVYGWPVGMAISQVEEDSAAAKAGLVKNDILVSMDGVDFSTMDELRELLSYYRAGETVKIEYYRIENGEYVLKENDITLGERK